MRVGTLSQVFAYSAVRSFSHQQLPSGSLSFVQHLASAAVGLPRDAYVMSLTNSSSDPAYLLFSPATVDAS
ncbi:hypothetical protein Syun_014868 [Stephania yunnanensis]|uniref:Uncharacterized protein n=1 Tax=Stephania yunnanensis TaxID=152371 RepID=A0AAP0JK52_9MAGN